MKKNNKGFFLAETIIIVALVTTVMAFVYPNVSKLYDNYKNTSLYYDQTEDLYTLKAYSEGNATAIIEKCNNLISGSNEMCTNCGMGIQKLFIYKYMDSPYDANYNFNKYLKRLKKTSNDQNACRLVGVFDGGKFASIKIEKESLYRQLYSVPELEVGDYIIFKNNISIDECKSSDTNKISTQKVFVTDNTNYYTCRIDANATGNASLIIKFSDGMEVSVGINVK